MKLFSSLIATTMVFVTVSPVQAADLPLEKRTYTDKSGIVVRYRLLKPDNYDDKQSYPLVLFLHGAGERGDDNEKQLVHGIPEFAKPENRKQYPCFLVGATVPEQRQVGGRGLGR